MSLMEGLWTYAAAAFALFLAHMSTATAVGGFVLVVVRLSYELPKAYRYYRKLRTEQKLRNR